MITVVTGNDKLSFKCQGQRVTSTKSIRVREDHNVQVKLDEGTLKKYVPAPAPAPVKPKPAPKVVVEPKVVVPKPKPEIKKK